jgi:hypothetical protein
MLASFCKGREIVKMILIRDDTPVRVFSYPRSYTEMTKYSRKHNNDDDYSSIHTVASNLEDYDNSLATATSSVRSYRSSIPIKSRNLGKKVKFSQSIAPNENVLTVLAEETSYILFKLLFNKLLSDSKEVGPGCLSPLTDTIFFLQAMQQARGDSYCKY